MSPCIPTCPHLSPLVLTCPHLSGDNWEQVGTSGDLSLKTRSLPHEIQNGTGTNGDKWGHETPSFREKSGYFLLKKSAERITKPDKTSKNAFLLQFMISFHLIMKKYLKTRKSLKISKFSLATCKMWRIHHNFFACGEPNEQTISTNQ